MEEGVTPVPAGPEGEGTSPSLQGGVTVKPPLPSATTPHSNNSPSKHASMLPRNKPPIPKKPKVSLSYLILFYFADQANEQMQNVLTLDDST